MLDLLAAIACSTAIALILKYGEERNHSRNVILAMNYTTATVISLGLVLRKHLVRFLHDLSIPGLADQLHRGNNAADGFLSAENTALWALLIGIPTGIMYFLGFHYYQRSVRDSGVGMAGSYAKMGILLPMVLSMIFWKELPGGLQWVGMALALISIAIVNLTPVKGRMVSSVKSSLLLLFLASGISEFAGKLFQRYGMQGMKDLFLFFLFATALSISIMNIRGKPKRNEILTGLAVGVPNFFASFFLINALSAMPASVVFPSYSAGSIALICIGGGVLYSEKPGKKESAAILLTMTALVLINL